MATPAPENDASGNDYVVVARPESLGLTQREGAAGMRAALAEIVDDLGGSQEAA